MAYGVIYIAHNPRDGKSLFKVGKTERPPEERMKELTSAPSTIGRYSAIAYFVVTDIDAAEFACHKRLNRYRVQDNREFFDIPLERLLQIVEEEVAVFSARDFVPNLQPGNTGTPAAALSADQLLAVARNGKTNQDAAWHQALEAAREDAKNRGTQLIDKAREAKRQLEGEDLLQWEIAQSVSFDRQDERVRPICSVLILSRFSKEPIALLRPGIRGGTYGEVDLSKAIGQPEVWLRSGQVEYLRWKEPDDGRVGRIALSVELENSSGSDRDRGAIPFAWFKVRATPIRYDDRHHLFEEKDHKTRPFKDPNESFEVFLSLVIENVATPQVDVRQRRGGSIYDVGKVLASGLED
jgi:hypothetical protein